jgi:tetratricopeptide (TPR) repeat protein
MDAKTLYQQGVTAIRDQNNPQQGRELLIQSLRQDPRNDMAWLWLTRTVQNRQKQLEYVERALRINPTNESAQKLKTRLLAVPPSPAASPQPPTNVQEIAVLAPAPSHLKTVDVPVTPEERDQIARLMERADIYIEAGETEAAIEQWIEVLKIRVDHETALRHAAGHLWRLQYRDDAEELVRRAIDAGTTVPSIYLTAIDIAERLGEHSRAEELREHIASLPQSDDQLLVAIADDYIRRYRLEQALAFLSRALDAHPASQKLLVKTGDLLKELDRPQEAMTYYDRAVRVGTRTTEGKEADRKLLNYVPVLTDRERGNVWLALREAVGVGMFFLVMGWQDAGLNLLHMGPLRWIGAGLGLIGGYLLVTATSSPQQEPIASWLGGQIPAAAPDSDTPRPVPGRALEEPTGLPIISDDVRYALGTIGAVLLVLALILVFRHTFDLVIDNPPPYLPWSGD